MSKIEWTEKTWNPVTGCSMVSEGCRHCYAVGQSHRLAAMAGGRGDKKTAQKYAGLTMLNARGERRFTGEVRCHEDVLEIPLRRRVPTTWFVNSMGDLFHKDVPFDFIDRVFAVMAMCPQHTFQVLTKRPERMAEYTSRRPLIPGGLIAGRQPWKTSCDSVYRIVRKTNPDAELIWPLPHVWLGTSVEDQAAAGERIPHLLKCPAAMRFLSCEPLLGALKLGHYLPPSWECPCGLPPCTNCGSEKPIQRSRGIDWVIIGGESGNGARPMHPDWARSLRDQCVAAGVPFFFKQWGEWVDDLQVDPTGDFPYEWEDPKRYGQIRFDSCAVSRVDGEYGPDADALKPPTEHVYRAGKKRSGRELDGRTWDEMPGPVEGGHDV